MNDKTYRFQLERHTQLSANEGPSWLRDRYSSIILDKMLDRYRKGKPLVPMPLS